MDESIYVKMFKTLCNKINENGLRNKSFTYLLFLKYFGFSSGCFLYFQGILNSPVLMMASQIIPSITEHSTKKISQPFTIHFCRLPTFTLYSHGPLLSNASQIMYLLT